LFELMIPAQFHYQHSYWMIGIGTLPILTLP